MRGEQVRGRRVTDCSNLSEISLRKWSKTPLRFNCSNNCCGVISSIVTLTEVMLYYCTLLKGIVFFVALQKDCHPQAATIELRTEEEGRRKGLKECQQYIPNSSPHSSLTNGTFSAALLVKHHFIKTSLWEMLGKGFIFKIYFICCELYKE